MEVFPLLLSFRESLLVGTPIIWDKDSLKMSSHAVQRKGVIARSTTTAFLKYDTQFRVKVARFSVSMYCLWRRNRGDRRAGWNFACLLGCMCWRLQLCMICWFLLFVKICCYCRMMFLLISPLCVLKMFWYVFGGPDCVTLYAIPVPVDHAVGSLKCFKLANNEVDGVFPCFLSCS